MDEVFFYIVETYNNNHFIDHLLVRTIYCYIIVNTFLTFTVFYISNYQTLDVGFKCVSFIINPMGLECFVNKNNLNYL